MEFFCLFDILECSKYRFASVLLPFEQKHISQRMQKQFSVSFLPRDIKIVKKKELSEEKRDIIVGLHKSGKSNKQIATELNIPRRTVDYNVKKFITKDTITNNPRQGRPKATTSKED